ncbi:STAS domain-containing protein [Lentzea sp. CC55]|uniref:STAS domain-containing protein n=1 Tax=Lentzea sp. CC55 TaxID=2884909 RepID=UPI001F2C7D86|nr:STAS domain-containing protein [Lentzea sp. CC55]MCG8925067.1 STAS domain-containing protein [Lentzea sp. CC55]
MNDDAFSMSVRPVTAGVVLGLKGDVDAHTSPGVLAEIRGLVLSEGELLVLDVSGMRFCDSSGISAFIAARNHAAAARADIVLVGVPRQTLRVLGMIGLDALFTFRPDLDDALSSRGATRTGGA